MSRDYKLLYYRALADIDDLRNQLNVHKHKSAYYARKYRRLERRYRLLDAIFQGRAFWLWDN